MARWIPRWKTTSLDNVMKFALRGSILDKNRKKGIKLSPFIESETKVEPIFNARGIPILGEIQRYKYGNKGTESRKRPYEGYKNGYRYGDGYYRKGTGRNGYYAKAKRNGAYPRKGNYGSYAKAGKYARRDTYSRAAYYNLRSGKRWRY